MDGQRATKHLERILLVADLLQNHAEAGQGSEMPRLTGEHLTQIGDRATIIPVGKVDGRAPVPGFHVVRLDVDDRAQELEREIGLLGVNRSLDAAHQQIGGVAA